MKFLLLKTLLLRPRRDEGFTLPMVIAIGMVMVLLSAVNLVQSGEENLIAISQEGSSDALAMAELGVSRYRDLLINNRVLAINNLDRWTDPVNNILSQVCTTGIDGTNGWADNTNSGWRNVDVNGNTIGSYRIVQYEYDRDGNTGDGNNDGIIDDVDDFDQVNDSNNDAITPLDGESDAVGILTVQGRDRIDSIAQLQVTIPLGVNTQDLEDLNPAIWIQQNSDPAPHINNFGKVDVNGANVVLSRPSGSGDCDDPSDLNSNNTISDPRELPPIIDQTTISTLTSRSLDSQLDQNTGTGINYYDSSNNKIILGTTLDDKGSKSALHTDGFYYYSTGAGNLILDPGEAIIADGNKKVILHIGGNLVIDTGNSGDRTRIVNSTHRTENDLNATIQQINNLTPPDIARYLEIHVEKDVTISGSGELFLTGLLRVGGKVNITGSSSTHIIGAIWANDWNNNGNGTVNVNIDNDSYKYYTITPNRTPAPLTYRPSGWERQEAD